MYTQSHMVIINTNAHTYIYTLSNFWLFGLFGYKRAKVPHRAPFLTSLKNQFPLTITSTILFYGVGWRVVGLAVGGGVVGHLPSLLLDEPPDPHASFDELEGFGPPCTSGDSQSNELGSGPQSPEDDEDDEPDDPQLSLLTDPQDGLLHDGSSHPPPEWPHVGSG